MKWKRRVTLLLAAGLLTITGCTEDGDSYKEPIVIDVYDTLTDYQGIQTGWYGRILEEKFNLQLNFLDTSLEESLEKADLYVCSEDEVSSEELLQAGLLLNLKPFLEEEPLRNSELVYYESAYEYWNEQYWNAQAGQEGIYLLPTMVSRMSEMTPSEENVPRYGIYLNWEAYENIGMPDIKDMDELLDVLEEMQDLAASRYEGLVLYVDNNTDLIDHISFLMGTQGGMREGFLINRESRYKALLEKDSLYLDMLEWLHEAYDRGLISENSDKLSSQDMLAVYREGGALMSIWPLLDTEGYGLAPVEDMKVVSYGCSTLGTVDHYVGVSAHAENPDRILEFVNWLYSTEGIMVSGTETDLKAAGPQGLTWDVEEGNPVLTEFGQQVFDSYLKKGEDDKDVEVPEEWGGGGWQQGSCKLNLQPVVSVEVSPSGFSYNYTLWNTTIEQYFASRLSWQERMDALEPMGYLIENDKLVIIPPRVAETVEKNEGDNHGEPQEIVDKRAACRQIIVDYSWKIIRAQSEAEADKLLDELKEKAMLTGYEDVVEYDRMVVSE